MPCSAAMRRIQLSDLMLIARYLKRRCCRHLRRSAIRYCGFASDLDGHAACDLLVDFGHAAIRIGHHRGLPESVSSRMRTSSGSRRARPRRSPAHPLAAAFAEDAFFVAAVRADMQAHVLDHAEHRDADLLEHLQALARIDQRDVLRRGDDHRAGDRHVLRQGQLESPVPGGRSTTR